MASLRRRLIFSHLLVILIVVPLLGLALVYFIETQIILVNLSAQLTRQAALIAEFTADYPEIWEDPAAAAKFVERFGTRLSAHLMLTNADGRLLAASRVEDAKQTGQLITAKGFEQVLQGLPSQETDYSQSLNAEIADVWIPIFNSEDELLGAVRLSHQLGTVRERFERVRALILQVIAASLLISSLIAYLIATTLERPLAALTTAVNRLTSGSELEPLPEQGPAELRHLSDAFNTLVERLTILRAARRQLLANLIHEIGRPLGALRAATQALLEGAADEPALRESLLTGMDSELAMLHRILDDLTRFYQRDVGPLDLQLQPVPLTPWLNTILAHWHSAAKAKGLNWETNIPSDLPTLPIDSDRLTQALGNLISNAIKFTPTGNSVCISAAVSSPNSAFLIRVEDTGVGIVPEERHKLFDPFFRSRRQARMPEGMGLGLTIARDLVIAHGGRLELDSSKNGGSTFSIWLPI